MLHKKTKPRKQKIDSAGFLIESNGLYLLGHATQSDNYIFNPEDRNWTIPKGVVDDGESLLDGAIRETIEETGFDVRTHWDNLLENPTFTIDSKRKTHHIFHLVDHTGTLPLRDFYCDSLIYNERVPHMNGKPEIDMFIWVNKKQAERLVFNTLKILFTE
jgi:8-oxo-dGTP pyrophosphatase MutT (NUDIX family)